MLYDKASIYGHCSKGSYDIEPVPHSDFVLHARVCVPDPHIRCMPSALSQKPFEWVRLPQQALASEYGSRVASLNFK